MISLDALDPIEFSLLLQRAKTKPEASSRLILGFKEQYGSVIADLQHALSSASFQEAESLARSLANVAGMLGAVRVAESAARLEHLLQQDNKHGLSQAITQLEYAMSPLLDAASMLEAKEGFSPGSPAVSQHARRPRGCILVIDDEPSMLELLEDVLRDTYQTLLAPDAREGLQLAERETPDLILLDVDLPDVDGYTLLTQLQKNEATAAIPVMFVTGSNDIASEMLGLRLGAVDYLLKPINPAILTARIHTQIKVKRAETDARRRILREHYVELVSEFERSSRLEETRQVQLKVKDEFLSHVSHELRAPTMSVYSFVSLVMDGIAGTVNPQQVEYLGIALRNIEHLQAMIEDLLEATRLGSGKLSIQTSDIFIAESVDYALHTISPAAQRKSIQLSAHCPPDLPSCQSDPTRLRQTLTILLDNAVKFTPAGGSVTVSARIFDQDPSALLIEIADTGCGIRQDKLTSVFDRLYQCAEPGQKGLGLGLHIAQELVQRQGGRIWVESVVAVGSTFCFTLPLSRLGQVPSLPDERVVHSNEA